MELETGTRKAQELVAPLLGGVTSHLARFLNHVLPAIGDDWWKKLVVDRLSVNQQQRLAHQPGPSLTSLDLAALLRVLDQNWFEITSKNHLSAEARHYVKEMQTIRNRWAHAGTDGVPGEDVYRDLDTLQRFAAAIGADEAFLEEIRFAKKSMLIRESPMSIQVKEEAPQDPAPRLEGGAEFAPGQMVMLKSNPAIQGAVIEVLFSSQENRFKVFMGGGIQIYYASQLQGIVPAEERQPVTCEQFHARLTALQILHPGLSTLYSLNTARVDFIPYQFRPVLKFIRSDRPRLLIADGVGVGKTIEAGLILRELQARRDLRSVLIICPRPLITESKWLNEMKRFEEHFTHLDGPGLRHCINEMDLDGQWPEQHSRVIVPYSLFDETLLYGPDPGNKRKRKKGLLALDPPPRFDLVIVDEAHHIRNPETFSHKAVRFFCDHAEAVLFLTATPIQLGADDLFVLLNTLRPDLIIDKASFEHMVEPNPFINQAAAAARAQGDGWAGRTSSYLSEAASTAWGQAILKPNPEFTDMQRQLSEDGGISPEERIRLIADIESLHTFAGIINRTRRRDIGDFTLRKSQTVTVEFTSAQRELHDAILQVQAKIFLAIHGDKNVKFMMTTIRRQAASCLFGLAPFLQEILSRHLDELAWEEADDSATVADVKAIDKIEREIQAILKMAENLDPFDPKLEALRKIIRNKQNLSNNKIMLFSSFHHTLYYLRDQLGTGEFRIGLIHGKTPDEDRMDLRSRFESPREEEDALDVLLFSEIGCEGLDYQFCDCIVNYDLPWNPMRIEQRIGRIDRNGQRSESVAIYNLVTPGTVDASIYERCLLRIGIFEHAMGDAEEILGKITRDIRNIAEDLQLSEEERNHKLQQLADNEIRLIQEQNALEEKQVELFGIRVPQDHMKNEIEDASSFWLSPTAIQQLISFYLKETCEKDQDFILGEKPLKTLRLSQEARSALRNDLQKLSRLKSTVYGEWDRWLKGGDPNLSITFDAQCAAQNPKAAFITPIHPLAKQAAVALGQERPAAAAFQVTSDEAPPGTYEFAIYQWQFQGIRQDVVLQPVVNSPEITPLLTDLLAKAVETGSSRNFDVPATASSALDAQHHVLWTQAREDHVEKTRRMAQYRKESLNTSHAARVALLREQAEQSKDEKIRIMRQAQMASAEADYARRTQELDIAAERADIIAEPVAYGVLQILEENAE